MFDELDKSAGLIGTVEYGIDEFLMNEEGDLWKRDEPDPTLRRYVSALLASHSVHLKTQWSWSASNPAAA